MSDKELDRYALGKVTQFTDQGDDPTFEGIVDVQLTDDDGGEVEFAFNVSNPKRRTYLRMTLRDLRRLLKSAKP